MKKKNIPVKIVAIGVVGAVSAARPQEVLANEYDNQDTIEDSQESNDDESSYEEPVLDTPDYNEPVFEEHSYNDPSYDNPSVDDYAFGNPYFEDPFKGYDILVDTDADYDYQVDSGIDFDITESQVPSPTPESDPFPDQFTVPPAVIPAPDQFTAPPAMTPAPDQFTAPPAVTPITEETVTPSGVIPTPQPVIISPTPESYPSGGEAIIPPAEGASTVGITTSPTEAPSIGKTETLPLGEGLEGSNTAITPDIESAEDTVLQTDITDITEEVGTGENTPESTDKEEGFGEDALESTDKEEGFGEDALEPADKEEGFGEEDLEPAGSEETAVENSGDLSEESGKEPSVENTGEASEEQNNNDATVNDTSSAEEDAADSPEETGSDSNIDSAETTVEAETSGEETPLVFTNPNLFMSLTGLGRELPEVSENVEIVQPGPAPGKKPEEVAPPVTEPEAQLPSLIDMPQTVEPPVDSVTETVISNEIPGKTKPLTFYDTLNERLALVDGSDLISSKEKKELKKALELMGAGGAPDIADVTTWFLNNATQSMIDAYNKVFRVQPVKVTNTGGNYGGANGAVIGKAWDDDLNTFWEPGNGGNKQIFFDFGEDVDISSLVYGSRKDAGLKGFATKFRLLFTRDSEATDDIKNYKEFAIGEAAATSDLIHIDFDTLTVRKVCFEFLESVGNYPSARAMYFYKEDTLREEISNLFVDKVCTSLNDGIDKKKVDALAADLENYPVKGNLDTYIQMAYAELGMETDLQIREVMKLSQMGNINDEFKRTGLTMKLANYDVTGYYVRPGETINIFVDADSSAPAPKMVLAAVGFNSGWQYGYEGTALAPGLNQIVIPETMDRCQAIYFYNPNLPGEQAYAPRVRIVGGTQYPVYRYDSTLSVEEGRKKEQEFIDYLKEYSANVSDWKAESNSGAKNPNMAEYISEHVLISTSAKGMLNSLTRETVWNKGDWETYKDVEKYGVAKTDSAGKITGYGFKGPAATMEAYEMMWRDMNIYAGFNITDPTHEDYCNRGLFLFRAYNNGAGAGWGQNYFSGYNCFDKKDGDPLTGGYFDSLSTPGEVLVGGWTLYHEMGHLFDSGLIGTGESTNNLFPISAQLKYNGITRMENENRWNNHFNNFNNTGVLPDNDLLFYPGAVIRQLDAVDFSKTRLYNDEGLSNYGMASRYARLHQEELAGLSKQDKLVYAFSMACGVDLSAHFEHFNRPVSDSTKSLLEALPKETRMTWLVTEKSFGNATFDDSVRNIKPVVSHSLNAKTGAVSMTFGKDTYDKEKLQGFVIYRVQTDGKGNRVGDLEFLGVTNDSLSTGNVDETYSFTDKNAAAGKHYTYYIAAIDRGLLEINEDARYTFDVDIPADAEIKVENLLINTGDEGWTMNVGATYDMHAVFFPENSTINLNSIEWWVEGYGRAENYSAGKDIIRLVQDENYPNDPTRMKVIGIQNGQTHVYVKLTNVDGTTIQRSHRIVINGSMNLNPKSFDFSFSKDEYNIAQGATNVKIDLIRKDKTEDGSGTEVFVSSAPGGHSWYIANPAIATINNSGYLNAVGAGTTTLEYRDSSGNVLAYTKIVIKGASIPVREIISADTQGIDVGSSQKIEYSYNEDATVTGAPSFVSSDPTTVRVSKDGTITGLKPGEATISMSIGGVLKDIVVTVTGQKPLRSIDMSSVYKSITTNSNEELSITTNLGALTPEEAAKVVWKSSDDGIVSVVNGQLEAKGTGRVTITATYQGKIATCTVDSTVEVPLDKIFFKGKENLEEIDVTLKKGENQQLIVYRSPDKATRITPASWSADNDKVTVSNGYITAVSEGKSVITVKVVQTLFDNREVEKILRCNVTVVSPDIPLDGVAISETTLSLKKDNTHQLTLTNRPYNANLGIDGAASWESSNKDVAIVDDKGNVTAVGPGSATITGTFGSFSAASKVVVAADKIAAESLRIDRDSYTFNSVNAGSFKLNATYGPTGTTESLFFKSSDKNVATVGMDGTIIPTGPGTATITAYIGGLEKICTITVNSPTPPSSGGYTPPQAPGSNPGTDVELPPIPDKYIPDVEDEGVTPPTGDEGVTPPAQDEGVTPPAQDENATPPTQDEGVTTPSEDPIPDKGDTVPSDKEDVTPPTRDEASEEKDKEADTDISSKDEKSDEADEDEVTYERAVKEADILAVQPEIIALALNDAPGFIEGSFVNLPLISPEAMTGPVPVDTVTVVERSGNDGYSSAEDSFEPGFAKAVNEAGNTGIDSPSGERLVSSARTDSKQVKRAGNSTVSQNAASGKRIPAELPIAACSTIALVTIGCAVTKKNLLLYIIKALKAKS